MRMWRKKPVESQPVVYEIPGMAVRNLPESAFCDYTKARTAPCDALLRPDEDGYEGGSPSGPNFAVP
jgi:hypothetical protein